MGWKNGYLRLYHGTDSASAHAIVTGGVNLSKCSPLTDFGQGFYTTTHLAQAETWAATRALRASAAGTKTVAPAIISLRVDRDWLGQLDSLVFPRKARETGYQEFVRHCRRGAPPLAHRSGVSNYDLVIGPVCLWQGLFDPRLELFVVDDCDQFSFHNPAHMNPKGDLLRHARVSVNSRRRPRGKR